jgi:serine/threonine protein kinase
MPSQSPHPGSAGGATIPLADRYRVLARVGLGGSAVVYRCVDLHTEHIVAVKVLRTNGPLIPEAAARSILSTTFRATAGRTTRSNVLPRKAISKATPTIASKGSAR